MKSQAQVLLIGKDDQLLRTRQLILGTFFQVETAGRISHAVGILANRHFDLIVLCYSLAEDERQKVEDLLQNNSHSTQILTLRNSMTLSGGCSTVSDSADETRQELNSDGGPYTLVKKCAEMLGVELKSIGRSPRQPLRRIPAFRF
jgi:hypothetical protein